MLLPKAGSKVGARYLFDPAQVQYAEEVVVLWKGEAEPENCVEITLFGRSTPFVVPDHDRELLEQLDQTRSWGEVK